MVTMTATVIEAGGSQVLVRDNSNNQEVLVHTQNCTDNLMAGYMVQIVFDGSMTHSLPPQISAQSICIIRER